MGVIIAGPTEYIDFQMRDYVDSRDIIERIEELQGTLDIGLPLDEDERQELDKLQGVAEEGGQYFVEWEDGVTLIADSYFVEYTKDFANDIGAVNTDASWPIMHIDWEAAANDLRMDYSSIEIDGITFWGRS